MIQISDLQLRHGKHPILNDLSFDVAAGQSVSILGPSGSGKTTLLRAIAGLHSDYSGSIRCSGKPIMLFQDLALWPHLTAIEHLTLVGCADAAQALQDVGICHRQHARPKELSGGEKQRLALARALAVKPQVLLLDEPLTSLDLIQKINMLDLILKAKDEHQLAIIHVTHDPFEAQHLSDRLGFLSNRRLNWTCPAGLQESMRAWQQIPA